MTFNEFYIINITLNDDRQTYRHGINMGDNFPPLLFLTVSYAVSLKYVSYE